MVRVQLDKTVGCGHRLCVVAGLVVGVCRINLCLLRKAAIGVACFQFFQQLNATFIVGSVYFSLGFFVKAGGAPALGFIKFFCRAACGQRENQRGDQE